MARSRNIKPGFFENEDLAEATKSARLLFIGMWTLCDRRGVLEDRPKRIKGQLFPYEDGTAQDIDKEIEQLQALGFLTRYEDQDTRLIFINEFSKHQHPHHKESESKFSLPTGENNTSPRQVLDKSGVNRDESCILKDESCIGKTPPQDLADQNFKEPKHNIEDVTRLTELATTAYKNTQFPHEVQPWIINLLGSVSAEVLEKAILKASAIGDKDHKFRKNFSKMFETAEAVKAMSESSAPQPLIKPRAVNMEDWN